MKSATKRVRREAVDPRGLVLLLDLARVHHRDPVRQRERLGLVVRHIDERDADLLLQVDQLELHVLAKLRVERGERLVEQQHRRVRDERPRDRDALLLPAGELVRIALAEALQANVLERGRDLRRRSRAAGVLAIWSGNATLPSTVMCGKSA